jgi:tRNA A37 methylthiotransferase MiaB
MLLQEEISAKRLQAKVGKTVRVLIDEVNRSGGDRPFVRATRRKSTAWCTSSAR